MTGVIRHIFQAYEDTKSIFERKIIDTAGALNLKRKQPIDSLSIELIGSIL